MPTLTLRGAGTSLTYQEGDEQVANPVQAVTTSPYSLTGANNREIIECGGSAATINLDAAATVAGTLDATATAAETARFEVVIKNTLATDITINPNGAETINGVNAAITLAEQDSVTLCLNNAGTAWITISNYDHDVVHTALPTTGSWTSASLAAGTGYEEVAVAHGLGTDDVDFGFSVSNSLSGSSQYVYNATMAGYNGQTVTDADSSGRSSLAIQMNTLTIATGQLGIAVNNAAGSAATLTVKWWARIR